MSFVSDCLSLLDGIIFAVLDIPLFAVFIGGAFVLVCLGLFLFLKSAVSGRGRK